MSLFGSVPELVDEEVHAWRKREQQARAGVDGDMLMTALASRLGLKGKRQLYRYMSGETPFPLEKVVLLCRALSSWKLLQAVNQEAGLVAEPKPDVGKLDGFDLIIEQSRNLKEFGELVAAYAEATDQPVSELELRRIEKEGREVIQQVQRLLEIYRGLVEQRRVKA
jgi:hypothetical protein